MATPEGKIKNQVIIKLNENINGIYWNNPTGLGIPFSYVAKSCPSCGTKLKHGAPIQYGLVGSADIMGVSAVTITPDMVGKVIGVATAVEVKTATGRQHEQQKRFQAAWERCGGKYILARSPEDVALLAEGVVL